MYNRIYMHYESNYCGDAYVLSNLKFLRCFR